MKMISSGSEFYKIVKNNTLGARDTAYLLRALITLAENQGSAPSSTIVCHNYPQLHFQET